MLQGGDDIEILPNPSVGVNRIYPNIKLVEYYITVVTQH